MATPSAPALPILTVSSEDQGKTWQDMRVDRFSPFTYGRDVKVSPQDPNTLYGAVRCHLVEALPGLADILAAVERPSLMKPRR